MKKNLLRTFRYQAGIDQLELAEKLGCDYAFLQDVENGIINPSGSFKVRVARILGKEVGQVFPK